MAAQSLVARTRPVGGSPGAARRADARYVDPAEFVQPQYARIWCPHEQEVHEQRGGAQQVVSPAKLLEVRQRSREGCSAVPQPRAELPGQPPCASVPGHDPDPGPAAGRPDVRAAGDRAHRPPREPATSATGSPGMTRGFRPEQDCDSVSVHCAADLQPILCAIGRRAKAGDVFLASPPL